MKPRTSRDHREADVPELLGAGGERPELLRLGEGPLDPVALLVGRGHLLAPRPRVDAVLAVGDHRQGVQVVQAHAAEVVGVEPLVPQHLVDPARRLLGRERDRLRQRGVVPLPLSHIDGDYAVLVDGDGLGREPAPRAAEGLRRAAPSLRRAPAACRSARTTVESIITRIVPRRSGSAALAPNRSSSRPEWIRRRSRL